MGNIKVDPIIKGMLAGACFGFATKTDTEYWPFAFALGILIVIWSIMEDLFDIKIK